MTSRTAWTSAGSLASAIASSACCWLPLVSLGAGVSTAGLAAWFEPMRPWFLATAALLLAAGFYLNYRRREACGPDGTCAAPNPRLLRFNRISLWVSTAFVVAFALFPSYVGALFGSRDSGAAAAAGDSSVVVLTIEGMTCEGCEAGVEEALARVPGVEGAEAYYARGRALVTLAAGAHPPHKALEMAVAAAGYQVTAVTGGARALGASAATAAGGAVIVPRLAGQWKAVFPDDELGDITVVMDVDTVAGGRWVGQFDIPVVGLENYPVTVTISGDSVTLDFSAIHTVIAARIAKDGKTLEGVARTRDKEEPAIFARMGEAQFSELFLSLESGADDPATVQPLSADGRELRAAFNRDADKVRVVMLLAPS